jgi:hypothetical protein
MSMRGLIFLCFTIFIVLSATPRPTLAAEGCPISPSLQTPSWCTSGLGGQFTAIARWADKSEGPLPVNYRICLSEKLDPSDGATIYYGHSSNQSAPLPQSATLKPGECFCAASTAGLQVASTMGTIVGGSIELFKSGTFAKNGLCPTAPPGIVIPLPTQEKIAECVSFYGGTPYHQGRCEFMNEAKPGNYRLCFPSDYSFDTSHTPAQFAGNSVKLFVNARYMETNEGQYDARRSSITTTCMDVFGAQTLQATVFEPQPNYINNYLPPPMTNPVPNFPYYWKSDDVKRIKVFVQSIPSQ